MTGNGMGKSRGAMQQRATGRSWTEERASAHGTPALLTELMGAPTYIKLPQIWSKNVQKARYSTELVRPNVFLHEWHICVVNTINH